MKEQELIKKVRRLKKYIKDIMWENAHDKGLLEDLIIKINEVFKEDLEETGK